MAKIAVELQHALARRAPDEPAQTLGHKLAQADNWTVEDVICTCGPRDRPFEEEHSQFSIAFVVAGTFQYRSSAGHDLMTPGSVLLGSPGQCFECGHQHGAGDRCISFRYAPAYFEQLAADAGARGKLEFRTLRLPPMRALSPLASRAAANLDGAAGGSWEELTIEVAARAVRLAAGSEASPSSAPPGALARVTRCVREIERHPDAPMTLRALAREARLSPYHFLRVFRELTGVTPHQYVLRARLREAASRLAHPGVKIVDIALDCGFGDVSNFNRAFRAEFGVSPRRYRGILAVSA